MVKGATEERSGYGCLRIGRVSGSALRGQERRLDRLREMGVWRWPRLDIWDSFAATAAPTHHVLWVSEDGRAKLAPRCGERRTPSLIP